MARLLPLLVAILLLGGCRKKPVPPPSGIPTATPVETAATLSTPKLPFAELVDPFSLGLDGTLAFQRARTICEIGSRAYGTPGHQRTLAYLRSELTRLGWPPIFQTFDAKTPLGDRTHTTLIATWPGKNPPTRPRLILAAHYDAPGSALVTFPAASSGAAGCGLLLEIAERLREHPAIAERLQLVFLDGEEPSRQISSSDGMAGSQFFIHGLVENGEINHCNALLAFGAIGHRNAHWTLPTLTDRTLNQFLQTLCFLQKWDHQVTSLDRPSWGPHLPALQAGLPATYLDDALYPATGTADDLPAALSAESLRRAGLAALQLLNLPARPPTK